MGDLIVIDRITLIKNGLEWTVSKYESTYTEITDTDVTEDEFTETLFDNPNIEFLTISQRESLSEAMEEMPNENVRWVEIIQDYYPTKNASLPGYIQILNSDQSEVILNYVRDCLINKTESFIIYISLEGSGKYTTALNSLDGSVKNLLKLGEENAVYAIHKNKVVYATSENLGIIDISSLENRILLEYSAIEIESDHLDTPALRFISETGSVIVSLLKSKEGRSAVYQIWEIDFEGNVEDLGRQNIY